MRLYCVSKVTSAQQHIVLLKERVCGGKDTILILWSLSPLDPNTKNNLKKKNISNFWNKFLLLKYKEFCFIFYLQPDGPKYTMTLRLRPFTYQTQVSLAKAKAKGSSSHKRDKTQKGDVGIWSGALRQGEMSTLGEWIRRPACLQLNSHDWGKLDLDTLPGAVGRREVTWILPVIKRNPWVPCESNWKGLAL